MYETFEMALLRNSLVRFRTSILVSPDSGGKSSGSTLAFIAISIHLSIGMFSWIPKFCSRSRSSWTRFFEGISDTLFCSRTCWQVLRLKLVFQELLHFGVVVNYLWESSTYVLHTTWNRSMKSNFFFRLQSYKKSELAEPENFLGLKTNPDLVKSNVGV